MLYIDGIGMGANWQNFLANALDTLDTLDKPQPVPPANNSSGSQNPVVAPIPVPAGPNVDPNQPTNEEISAASNLIQSLADQYRPKPPDITVDDDQTKAAQQAIQGAQTQYDNAFANEKAKQGVLMMMHHDPETTSADLKQAEADYTSARDATQKAQRELNVTADAGYMLAYGKQADADQATADAAKGDVADKLKALKALIPGASTNDNYVPNPQDIKTAADKPAAQAAYDAWQIADAKETAALSASSADIANSNLAYAQLQSYASNPDYKDAMVAGVGRLNDALAPLGLQLNAPAAIDDQQQASANVNDVAKVANLANAWTNAAADALTLANAQAASDGDTGKFGGPVIASEHIFEYDQSALTHAQAAAATSGSYLQMLVADGNVDTARAAVSSVQGRYLKSEAGADLSTAQQQAQLAHDNFVATFGGSLALQYADTTQAITDKTANNPLNVDPKTMQSVVSALRAADGRLADSVNERSAQNAVSAAQSDSDSKKFSLSLVQGQYDDWNQQHGRTTQSDNTDRPPRPGTPVNPYGQALADAQNASTQADTVLGQAKITSELIHQQVLMDQFRASLPDNLLNPKSESDQADYQKRIHDFYEQHRSDMSQSLLDSVSQSTLKGQSASFGDTGANPLTADQQRNLIGTALGLQPDGPPVDNSAQSSDPNSPAPIDKTLHYSGDALSAINKVRDEIMKVGGANAQVSVMPVVYASQDSGMATTSLFKVTNPSGSTYYIDQEGAKYTSTNDYVDNNHLSASGTLDIATGYDANGVLQIKQSEAHHESWLEKLGASNLNLLTLAGGMALDLVGGLLDASVVLAPLGVTLDVVGTGMIWGSVGASALNAGNDLYQRAQHDQSMSITDPGARSDYINLLPLGAAGAAKGIKVLAEGSRIAKLAEGAAKVSAWGGAIDAGRQTITDAVTGHTDRVAGDVGSVLENVVLLKGHEKLEGWSQGLIRRNVPYGLKGDGGAVRVDGQKLGVYAGPKAIAAHNYLTLDRTAATLDGRTVGVARDGTLMVGHKAISYDGMPVHVRSPGNPDQVKQDTLFVDQDGNISKYTYNRFGPSKTEATGEKITFGTDGSLTLSDNLSLASTKNTLLPSAPAPKPPASRQNQNQNASQSSNPTQNGGNSTSDTQAIEASATTAAETATTAQTVESRVNQGSAQILEQQQESAITRNDDTRADQRRSDQQQVQFRRVVDPHSSAGAGAPSEASPVSFKARIVASVLNADEPMPAQRSLIDSIPTGEPPQADPTALPFDSSHSIYVVRAAGMPESAPRTAAVPPRNLSSSAEAEPPVANSKALSGSAPNASGPIDLSDHVGELAGYTVQKGAVIKPASTASFMVSKASAPKVQQRGPATQAEFNSLEQWRLLSLQTRTANGLLSPSNRIVARLTVPNEIRVNRETALETQGLSLADEVAPNETNLAAPSVSSEPGNAATSEPERHAGTLVAAGAGSRAGLQMPHPAMADGAGAADAPKPRLIERIQMRMGGAPLPNEVSALVQQSGTLSQQLRLLNENGWKVRRGKPGNGSRIDMKRRRVTIDGRVRDPGAATYVLAHETQHAVEAATGTLGLDYSGKRQFTRSALEAEARAQLNAFESRYEISLSGGGDIGEHAGLPESIEREYSNWQAGDRAGLAQRLSAAFAEAPVSIQDGKTYQAFYDEVWASQNARTMPAPNATEARLPATFRERTDWSRENAQEDSPFEGSLLSGKHPDHSLQMGPVTMHQYEGQNLYVVRGSGTAQGELHIGDGPLLSGHEFTVRSRYTFPEPYEMREPVILSVANAELKFAPELANVWQKSIFVAPEGAIGSDGQLRATSGYLRIDPAPYQLRDLGPLTANTEGIFFDGEAHRPVDLAEHLGALIGFGVQKGGFELGANAVVGVYSQGGTTAADHVQAATTEFESLERLRFLGLRTLTMDGVFSVANRVAVLYQPRGEVHSHEVEAAYAHLRNQFTSREVAAGKLPANIRRTTLDQFDTIRRIVTQEKLAFDFQGIYRDGHFYLSDPNRIEYGADEYHDAVLQKIDEQINAIARGIAERKILVDGAPLEMPHPAMAEKGPYSSKPGLIDRIRMRLFGAPLPDEVSALVSQSSTLSNQLRMLDSKGWKVVRGKPGSGSRISTKTKTVTIDGGLRDAGSMTYVLAHEARHAVEAATGTLGLDYGGQGRFTRSALQAEARAQLNAFEARYQISLASGVDIAARTSLPEAIEREYGNWATGDRAELTQRLSEAFAEAPVSVKGGKTYQTFYDEVWARQKTHTPSAMTSPDGIPHPDGQTQGAAAGASDADGVPRSSPALDQPPLYASETHDDLTGIPKVIHPADRITSAPPLAEHGVRKLSVGHPAFDFSSTPENTYESVTLRPGFADALTNRPGVLGDVARVMRPGGRVTLERPSGLLEEPDPRAAIDATARELEAAGFVNVRTEFVTGDGSTVDLGNLSNDPGSLDPEAGYLRFSGDVRAEPANAHDGLRKLLAQALAQGVGSADDVYGLYNKVPAQEAARFSLSADQQGRYLDQLRQLAGDRPDGSVEAVQTSAGVHDSIADFLAKNPGFGGGYYHFMPPEGVGPEYDDVQERVYINATPEHAPDVMRFLVKDIMDRPEDFPGVYSAKIAGPKSAPGRSENIVVYITDAHDRQPVVDALAAYQQAHPDHFRSDVPHMTEGALRGVSTAAEVSADMKTKAREAIASARGVDVSEVQDDFSFGEQRAEAIWLALRDTRARQNEAGPNFDAAAYLRARTGQRLAQFGVDPSNPARNLAPADYVSVDAHAVDERTVRLTTVDGHAVDVRVYGGARGARPTRLADIRMPGQPDSRQPFELLHDPETGEPAIIRRIMGAAESPEPQPTPAATPSVRPVDTVLDQVETLAEGKRVVVFGGYSGLGYRDVDALKAHIASTLNAEVAAHGAENLLVVAGATSDGIGVAYEVAKSHGLATAGIVSEAAREFGASPYCDQVIYVPDPHENWQVMAPDGRSYMLSIAQDNGIYYAFGGGDVTVAELAEARERNIPTEVDASFEPDQDKLNKRLERAPDTNPTPVRTWLAGGVRHAGTTPVPADSSERLPSSFDERVAYSLAHARPESPFAGGDYAPRPSLITRILMRFRGVPVSGDVSALAQHSSLLSEHMRLLSDHGWQVKMGRVGGGSKINERRKQIVIDGGLRRTGSIVYSLAHEVGHAVDAINGTLGLDGSGKEAFVESALEAEARAQAVAFRVRDEIKAAQEIDIAEHVRLPDAIEREAGRARADDPASLERLAAAFADAPTSLKGNRTYRQHYEAAWAKQRMRWHTADGIEMPAPTTPNPPAVPGGSAPAERAARWLDARGLRKLQRVEGARVSNLADLAVEAGPGAHVLIAERSARRAGEQPTFIAHTQLDEHGVPGEIHPTAPGGKLPPVVKRALSHLDTSNKSVKARGKLDFYLSPVPLETLNAFGGAAEIAETGVPETEKLPVAATGVSQQVAETIGKLAGVQHFASARQAANHAVHDTDTIYAVDAKTGVPLGHARKIDDAWQYTENAPVAGTRVAPAKLKSAFREHAGRVPMPWTSRKGVRFVISDQSPETVEAFGGFDPMLSKRAARKAEKPARDPHRSGADLTLLGIYRGRARLHALARLREAQRAAHRTEAAARKVSPVTRGIAPNLLPEQPLHAVNFRGINFVHLLRASELGAIKEGKHHIYVYDSEGDIAHMTNNARGRLEMRGKELRWFGDWKNHDANAPGVSIDESPIGRGPHGANMQFLLSELDPKALEAHAKANKGTGLLGSRRRTTDIEIKPYQPALSSATVTELIARYGKIKESWLFPQLAALKEYASRKRNASATPVELTDAAVDRVPDVVVADATQWKALHLPLHVARDDSPNGLSQFSPLPTRRAARLLDTATGWQARLLRNYVRAGRRLSVATVSDTKLIRHFLAADPAVQDRVAPMGRAFTLLDNPEQAVERVKRTGGAMPVVTLVVDPNTLNAAQGKKHDPQFVAAVKRLGALKGATVDYENGVIRGANNEVLPLDHLNEKTLFAWLDAAREAGFALRLETAPSRHLVSAHDKAIQAGTNDSYHEYVRTFSLLEDWAKRNAGTRAPQVMVTFHGWDTVLESVPGGGHAKLVEAVLDRQTLNWVHMGLGYGTHGSDSIANEELTTALARLIVKYAGQPEKLARIHGDDALTRVFDRPAASLLVEQQRPLLIELDRVGREDGLPPAAIARIRERIYQRNTTDFVNQARLAETTYAQRHWNPSGNGKAQAYARRWMTDVGSHLRNPGNRTLPSAPGKLTPWAQIVSDPALKNDAKKAVSESRETAAQLGQDEIAKDEQALAELTALHLAPIEKNWRTRFLTGATIVGLGGVATVLGTNQFNLFDTLGLANLKTATPHLLTATRIARMFQAAHQASVRSLQNGDPRVFDKVADTLVERLSSQLPNYDRTSKRSAQLQLLADEGKANVARIRWLHKEHGLSYTDAVEQTQIIVGDMLGQMQGAFTGTALKQIHQGNPRHWLGTAARISALAGYTGTLAMDIHALAGNDPWLTVLPTAGVLLSGTYTGMVLLGRRQGVNVDQRSRVARFADSASDAFTASGGLLGASSQLIENHWFAGGTAAASSLILSAGWLNARFPNATPKVSKVPIWLALLPIGIFIGNQIAPFFMNSNNSSGNTGPQPPASTNTPSASASPSPGVSASPTTGASASPAPSASPSTPATPGASASPGQPGQPVQTPNPTPTAQRYLVAEGDSLWVIADRNRKTLLNAAHVSAADQQGMSEGEQDARALQEIFQLNPQLAGGDANLVYPGQQIVIG
ncbi:LWXIA domain-containing protein [Paraburkholderia madseniana]|uniref:LWXIA domain-containing protein n=1 Tax=Paraburkholderia madseniana TaxID=2599607 RepID=UPI001496230B|nr:LWXIA domain-containing protein [Paraburkholderia madseniana]NPT66587.1 LWXIA domain-containing protein [Paraburkholderia madseniana]